MNHVGLDTIDNIILIAMNEKKGRVGPAFDDIAQRRGLEIDPPVIHRRAAQKSLNNMITGPHGLIVMPLLQHVVDAVIADDGADLRIQSSKPVLRIT